MGLHCWVGRARESGRGWGQGATQGAGQVRGQTRGWSEPGEGATPPQAGSLPSLSSACGARRAVRTCQFRARTTRPRLLTSPSHRYRGEGILCGRSVRGRRPGARTSTHTCCARCCEVAAPHIHAKGWALVLGGDGTSPGCLVHVHVTAYHATLLCRAMEGRGEGRLGGGGCIHGQPPFPLSAVACSTPHCCWWRKGAPPRPPPPLVPPAGCCLILAIPACACPPTMGLPVTALTAWWRL